MFLRWKKKGTLSVPQERGRDLFFALPNLSQNDGGELSILRAFLLGFQNEKFPPVLQGNGLPGCLRAKQIAWLCIVLEDFWKFFFQKNKEIGTV
ncbi:hypothetical protein CDAR_616921 [Caerostris darwini]|uniref:Uncharacterized protein n=1 Tax=Caerostris darwini TaxID=1538125 RepID=A0AAV4RWI8_9ARAC|nr:hypothetical protein CDAR_616921 [Caerostris darwini]